MIINSHSYLQTDIYIDSILDNNTWDVISAVTNIGQAQDYWNLGDTKTDGNFTCRIVAFNYETQNSITFAIEDIGTGSIAFNDFSYLTVYTNGYATNWWERCDYFNSFLKTKKNQFSQSLKNILKTVPKSSNKITRNDTSQTYVTYTSDYAVGNYQIWIPSSDELLGVNLSGTATNKAYDWYKNNTSRLPTGTYWLRDIYSCSCYHPSPTQEGLVTPVNTITFTAMDNKALTTLGYTDQWRRWYDPSGPAIHVDPSSSVTKRTGTTIANLIMCFTV